MCGIAGFLTSNAAYLEHQSLIDEMIFAIKHRGPDGNGVLLDKNNGFAVGHSRLSIVDLSSAGAQPMTSKSGRWIIAFNGEIYNHKNLRAELEKSRKINWIGSSDTETLLNCFDEWGVEKTVSKCVGMFAIALWCRSNGNLTLIRDRLGEKPLYYGWQGKGSNRAFLFGSEIKSLRVHPAFTGDLSSRALATYFQNMAIAGTDSIFKGIHKVPPGTLLTVSLQKPDPVIERYWSLADVAVQGACDPFTGSAKDAVGALELLLKDAVSQQMIADVPLGAFLSGGVDSSTIVALMQAQSARPVKTFSIGFEEDAYNEAEHARAVAKHLGTEHTDLYVTPQQALDVIPRLPSLYDEPFADSSQIPTYLVSQMTRQHVTVALSGDAGDELFAGYNRYLITASLWPKLSRVPQTLRQAAARGLTRFSPDTLNRWARYLPASRRWVGVGDKLHKGASVMVANSADALYSGLVATGWPNPIEILKERIPYTSPLHMPDLIGLSDVQRMMAFDGMNYLPDDILTKVDRAAMGVSLETRVPFLDHRVVEFAWRLPMAYKLRREKNGWISKWALRQVLYRHVPRSLIERPKAGFGVPLDYWLRGPLRDWAEDLLSEDRIKRDGFLNSAPVRKKWAEHLSGQRNHQHALWCVLMFQAWLDQNKVSIGPSA